jgi:hypothetical protein
MLQFEPPNTRETPEVEHVVAGISTSPLATRSHGSPDPSLTPDDPRISSTDNDRLDPTDIDGAPVTVKLTLEPVTDALRFPAEVLNVPTSEPSVSVRL